MKKNSIIYVVVLLVVAGGAFYGGMTYAKSTQTGGGNFANFQNMTPEQRQQRLQQAGVNGGAGRGGRNGGGVMGSVISKDDKSITIQMPVGGSKIIFYSPSTTVQKLGPGTIQDVAQGVNVAVMGVTNSDGSVTAQNIQLRPAMIPPAAPANPAPTSSAPKTS